MTIHHRRHHPAGCCKMMTAMMRTSHRHKGKHRRDGAASCCDCETHLLFCKVHADEVPILPRLCFSATAGTSTNCTSTCTVLYEYLRQ